MASRLSPATAAAAIGDDGHRRLPAGPAFDRLLDRVWDMGGGHPCWGGAPGGNVWVGFHGPRGWEELHGPSLDFCAMALQAIVFDTDEEPGDAAT